MCMQLYACVNFHRLVDMFVVGAHPHLERLCLIDDCFWDGVKDVKG